MDTGEESAWPDLQERKASASLAPFAFPFCKLLPTPHHRSPYHTLSIALALALVRILGLPHSPLLFVTSLLVALRLTAQCSLARLLYLALSVSLFSLLLSRFNTKQTHLFRQRATVKRGGEREIISTDVACLRSSLVLARQAHGNLDLVGGGQEAHRTA